MLENKWRCSNSFEELSSKKRFMIFVECLILFGAVGAILYYALGLNSTDRCLKILESMNTGEVVQGADMNPLMMAACRLQSCAVDLSKCPVPCPFSYETDDLSGCPKSCDCATSGIYQGDLRFEEHEVDGMMRKYGHRQEEDFVLFFGTAFHIWNETIVNGRMKVPYRMSPVMSVNSLDAWNEVVEDFALKSCIDLIHWTKEEDFMDVVQTVNCASSIGRLGGGQLLEIGLGCGLRSTVQHEILHALGFDHEQSRPDRDLHVNIHEENIPRYYLHNFNKLKEHRVLDLGSEYEQESCLHYRSDDFGIKGKIVLTFKPGERIIRTDTKDRLMTEEDFREVNLLYKCKTAETVLEGTWEQWSQWSDCTVTCENGFRTRARDCSDSMGGKMSNCLGGTFEYKKCVLGECPPPQGIYDEWGEWGACDEECGIGRRTRFRACPLEYVNGCDDVFGKYHGEEKKTCREKMCDGSPNKPIHKRWSTEWIEFKPCNASCGGGIASYSLSCYCGRGPCHLFNCDPEYTFTETAEDWYASGLLKYEQCNTGPCEEGYSQSETLTEALSRPISTTYSSPHSGPNSHPPEAAPWPSILDPSSQYPSPWPSVPGPDSQYPSAWPPILDPNSHYPSPWSSVPDPNSEYPSPWPSVPDQSSQYPTPWPFEPTSQYPSAWPPVLDPNSHYPSPWSSVPVPSSLYPSPWPSVPDPNSEYPSPWPSVPDPNSEYPSSWPSVPNPSSQYSSSWPSVSDTSTEHPFPWTFFPESSSKYPSTSITQDIFSSLESTGTWSKWEMWGICDKLCGNGNQIRNRNCLDLLCIGVFYEMKSCFSQPCPGPPSGISGSQEFVTQESLLLTNNSVKNLFQTTWLKFQQFCAYGKLMTGYFNTDSFEDFLCYYNDGTLELHFSSNNKISQKPDWSGQTSSCLYVDDVFIRDISGDGIDDIICRNVAKKNFEVLINHGGSFRNVPDWTGQRPICQMIHEVFNVEDLDGDEKADLICGNHGSALQQVIFHE